jgi:hypothetical protein
MLIDYEEAATSLVLPATRSSRVSSSSMGFYMVTDRGSVYNSRGTAFGGAAQRVGVRDAKEIETLGVGF